MGLKLGYFGKKIRNVWKVLKRGAAERWRRSVGPTLRKKVLQRVKGGEEYRTYSKVKEG